MFRRLTILSMLLFGISTPALAQSAREQEIQQIRVEIARLSERLDQLAAEPEDSVPPPSPVVPAAPPAPAAETPVAALASSANRPFIQAAPARAQPVQVAAAPIGNPVLPPGADFEITAAAGKADVAFKVTTGFSNPNLVGRSGAWAEDQLWTFTAQAPLNEDGDYTELARFGRLTSGIELSLGWSNYRRWLGDPRKDETALAIESQAREDCRRTAPEADKAACATAAATGAFIGRHSGERAQRRWLDRLFGAAQVFGVEASLGYRDHGFVDQTTLAMSSEAHIPWGIKAFYAYLPKYSLSSWTFSAEYQDAVEDADKGVLCPPSSGAAVQCLSGPLGRPSSDDRLLTSIEYRSQFETRLPLFPRIGTSLEFSYDHESDTYGIDLPIYLVSDDKGGLTGGVRLGYTSEDDDFVAAVFIGAPLSLR